MRAISRYWSLGLSIIPSRAAFAEDKSIPSRTDFEIPNTQRMKFPVPADALPFKPFRHTDINRFLHPQLFQNFL